MTRRRAMRLVGSIAFYAAVAVAFAWCMQRRIVVINEWCDDRGPR
jgi:hypothetical protein